MDVEQEALLVSQLPLFQFGEITTGQVELFPTVWGAAESLSSSEVRLRQQGLDLLIKCGATRLSPLITYVIYTRLTDPDMETRSLVVQALADVLTPDDKGRQAPEPVRQHLMAQLGRMRTREIYALLQLLAYKPDLTPQVGRLMNACPYAGAHLAELAASRKAPLEIRRYAIRLAGEVGYCDVIPTLERMLARLESKVNGQQSMAFAPPVGMEDADLLPEVKGALEKLSSL
jgi:hypothetical protein